MNTDLQEFIDSRFYPIYAEFDGGNNGDHYRTVTQNILAIVRENPDMNFDENLAYLAAAYHDCGIAVVRENHSIYSAERFRQDAPIYQERWGLTQEDVDMLAIAIEDHTYRPERGLRNSYSELLYYADKLGFHWQFARRSILFNLRHNPQFTPEEMFENAYSHCPKAKPRPTCGKFFRSRMFDEFMAVQQRFAQMSREEAYQAWLQEYRAVLAELKAKNPASN